MAYTWTELLDDIKVRGAVPTSQPSYTEARLLRLANAVMASRIVPDVMKAREQYYEYDVDSSITDQATYAIPTRAVGGKLSNVAAIDGTKRMDLSRYFEEELDDYLYSPSIKMGFYIKRNSLYLLPADGGGWSTLRLSIIMRPNQIVAQSSAAQISSISSNTLTCTSVPASWTSSNTFDLVQANPHFDWLGIDKAASAVVTGTNGTITLSATPPSTLAVGDWVGLSGQTPVVQCPVEFHPLLAQEVANICLKAQGDEAAYKLGLEEANLIRESVMSTINPRVESEGKKLVNRSGLLRRRL